MLFQNLFKPQNVNKDIIGNFFLPINGYGRWSNWIKGEMKFIFTQLDGFKALKSTANDCNIISAFGLSPWMQ